MSVKAAPRFVALPLDSKRLDVPSSTPRPVPVLAGGFNVALVCLVVAGSEVTEVSVEEDSGGGE